VERASRKNGDTYDRYWVRVEEMRQSRTWSSSSWRRFRRAGHGRRAERDATPKDKVFNDLASMIQQFKLFSDGSRPEGEIYCGTEAAKASWGLHRERRRREALSPEDSRPSFIHMVRSISWPEAT